MDRHVTIMVVDDDETIRRLLRRTLTFGNYEVISADSGGTALTLFEEHRPNLVILDIIMPVFDGFEVLHQIRQQSDVPVIMLSGIDKVNSVRDSLYLGADDYIRKPFGTLELLARVKAKLRRADGR